MTTEASLATIVLLPGMDGTGTLFKNWIDAVPAGFDLMVIDFPVDIALGYEELLQIVRARLPQDRPYWLLAESFSGPIGLTLAARAPAGLLGLILCCTFAKNPMPVLTILRPAIALLSFPRLPLWLARIGHRALFGRHANAESRSAISEALCRLHPSVLQARMRAVLDVDVTTLLARITLPVLYLRGGKDRVVPQSASRQLSRYLQHMDIAQLDAPHMLLQTAPHEAWRTVRSFIEQRRDDA